MGRSYYDLCHCLVQQGAFRARIESAQTIPLRVFDTADCTWIIADLHLIGHGSGRHSRPKCTVLFIDTDDFGATSVSIWMTGDTTYRPGVTLRTGCHSNSEGKVSPFDS